MSTITILTLTIYWQSQFWSKPITQEQDMTINLHVMWSLGIRSKITPGASVFTPFFMHQCEFVQYLIMCLIYLIFFSLFPADQRETKIHRSCYLGSLSIHLVKNCRRLYITLSRGRAQQYRLSKRCLQDNFSSRPTFTGSIDIGKIMGNKLILIIISNHFNCSLVINVALKGHSPNVHAAYLKL